jgi:hypothetical protein
MEASMHTITINSKTGEIEIEDIDYKRLSRRIGLQIVRFSEKIDRKVKERRLKIAKRKLYQSLKELRALGVLKSGELSSGVPSFVDVRYRNKIQKDHSAKLKSMALQNGHADLKIVRETA